VLVVEDNDDDVVLLREAFDEVDAVEVLHVARDGDEALAFLRREGDHHAAVRPELVLLDINMPRRNGFEVLAALKSDPVLRAIPVVMLTTSRREDDVREAYGQGASSYIPKPVDYDHLQTIARCFVAYWSGTAHIPRDCEVRSA
jgi:CheY-like chemotaxis protein